MGWLSGVLSGYADQHEKTRQENAALAEEAAKRESAIYQQLLNSDDEKVRGMAATGIMQMGQPRRGKGGFAGWMGEMQSSPIYPILMQYMKTPQRKETEVPIPGLPSTQTSGYLPLEAGDRTQSGAPSAGLSLPATSPTAGGVMDTPQPQPSAGPPPPPPDTLLSPDTLLPPTSIAALPGEGPTAPGPPAALDPTAPGPDVAAPTLGPPPAPPQLLATRQVAGQPNAGRRTDVTYETPHFPTVEDAQIKTARAKEYGDYLAYVDVFKRVGDPDPEGRAAALIAAEKQHSAAGSFKVVPVEFTGPDGRVVQDLASFDARTGRFFGQDGQPLPADARPAAKGGTGRALNKREEIAIAKFGRKYNMGGGVDPTTIMKQLSPEEHETVLREEGILASEAALRKARDLADAPLTKLAVSNLTESLAREWRTLQAPQRLLAQHLQKMNVGVNRIKEDPNGASQAILVTFQKLLDPPSVVRESEYMRSGAGLPLTQRVEGMYDRLVKGGAGVPEAELRAMAETARQFAAGQEDVFADERQRIEDRAAQNGIDPGYIFGGGVAKPPPTAPAVVTGTSPTTKVRKATDAAGRTTIVETTP